MQPSKSDFILLIMMCIFGASSLAPAQSAANLPPMKSEKYKLANGLEVILSENHRLPVVAANVWYHVGPMNEEPGRTGFAHLFEHMMFQGTKHVVGDSHFRLLERAGATGINGTTDFDRTNYFETVPANQLELALWLESDRMGYLLDTLDQAKLSNQQDVVRNERRQTTENRPYGVVEETVYHQLFPKEHPYYASVIGSHADIQAARLEDVKRFFRLYYAPNNATLALVGDFDSAQAKKLVEKYFGTLKGGEEVPKASAPTPPILEERRAVVQDRIELPRVYMSWLTPPVFAPGDAEAALAAQILGGGESSRLYKKLVYEKQIAQQVRVSNEALALRSVFVIQATARPGHTLAELERAVDEELERFRQDGPEPREVEAARNLIETRLLGRLETAGRAADLVNYYNHYLGDPNYLGQDVARYDKVTPPMIQQFAGEYLKNSSRSVVEGVPGKQDLGAEVPTPKEQQTGEAKAEPVNTDEAWRTESPKAAARSAMRLPTPHLSKLANGLTIIHTETPGLGLVAASLVVRSGSAQDPLDKMGLASFAATLLDQGTQSRNALQIADEVAQLGAMLDTESTTDSTSVSVRSLKKNFAAALSLLGDVSLHPSFPAAEIDRQRASSLANLLDRKGNAAVVAEQVLAAVLYGREHPYGYPEVGTETSLKGITAADLKDFWKSAFVPKNAALIVAGDISQGELASLAEKLFGTWSGGAPPKRDVARAPAPAARVVIVDKPGAAQTQLRIGMVGVPRSNSDYAALEIMNSSLGGLFSSRINLNLREDKGYTYGAGSRFTYRVGAGPFRVSTGVRTAVTAPSVTEIFKELRRIADAPVTSEELALAKDSQVLSLPGRFETTNQALMSFSNVFVYDLGLDYYNKLPAMLSNVSSDAVRAVAKKYLMPDKMVVVAVGDRATIEAPLRALALGAVEIRDADGFIRLQ